MELDELKRELDKAQDELKKAVHENFGYVGSDVWANKCVDKVNILSDELRMRHPEEYMKYLHKYYGHNP